MCQPCIYRKFIILPHSALSLAGLSSSAISTDHWASLQPYGNACLEGKRELITLVEVIRSSQCTHRRSAMTVLIMSFMAYTVKNFTYVVPASVTCTRRHTDRSL